jgi:hypothetical protein
MLTEQQATNANQFYSAHRNYINYTVNTVRPLEPLDEVVRNNPIAWLGCHWKWFLNTYH